MPSVSLCGVALFGARAVPKANTTSRPPIGQQCKTSGNSLAILIALEKEAQNTNGGYCSLCFGKQEYAENH
jgi:hypothetical protein